jgi:hypothetical protein
MILGTDWLWPFVLMAMALVALFTASLVWAVAPSPLWGEGRGEGYDISIAATMTSRPPSRFVRISLLSKRSTR